MHESQRAMAAVAEAELPVPEEVVGPTPRSKMRISISRALMTRNEFNVGLVRENQDARRSPRRWLARIGRQREISNYRRR